MLGTDKANLGVLISEGRCCELGNFLKTRLSNKQLLGPRLAKARSRLVPLFGRSKNWRRPWHCIRGQGNLYLLSQPSTHRPDCYCCNPNQHDNSSNCQRKDRGDETLEGPEITVALVEVCRL